MPKLFFIILIIALQLEVVRAQELAPIKVGWIGPLSGDVALLGTDSAAAIRMVFEGINKKGGIKGRQVQLITEDDQYVTQKTINAYKKLSHLDKAQIIFVITYGGHIALAEESLRDKVIMINPLDCDEELAALPRNNFCVAKNTEDLGRMNAEHAARHDNAPAAIIYFNADPFMPKVAKATKEKLESLNKRVVVFEGISPDTVDYKPLLLRIKSSGAKTIFLYGFETIGRAIRDARSMGMQQNFYSLAGVTTPGFVAQSGPAVNGTFTAGWFAPKNQLWAQFLEKFKESIGRSPHIEVSTVPSYDLANLIVDGLSQNKIASDGSINFEEFIKYMYAIKEYKGVSGEISMSPDGSVRSLPVGMHVFSDGTYTATD